MFSSVELAHLSSESVPVSADKAACEILNNMRKERGEWRPVSEFEISTPLGSTDGYEIIYKHDVFSDSGGYILLKNNNISYCRITGGQMIHRGVLCTIPSGTVPDVTSSGNILFITWTEGDRIVEKHYLMRDNLYETIDMDSLEPPLIECDTAERYQLEDNGSIYVGVGTITELDDGGVVNDVSLSEHYAKINDRGYITGSAYILAAYRTVDGTVAVASSIKALPVEYNDMDVYAGGLRMSKSGNVRTFSMTMNGMKPNVKLTLPDGVSSNPLIRSVVIYSTDDTPVYDPANLTCEKFDAASRKGDGSDANYYYARRTVMLSDFASQTVERPFYLLKEIELSDFVSGTCEFTLSYDDFKNIVHNELYSPTFSVHQTVSVGKYEYNNRLHRYNLQTRLYCGNTLLCTARSMQIRGVTYNRYEPSGIKLLTAVAIDCDDSQHTVIHEQQAVLYFSNDAIAPGAVTDRYLVFPNMLAYPDSRAVSISFILSNGKGARRLATYKLKANYENNAAYWCSLEENLLHHIHVINIGDPTKFTYNEPIPVTDGVLREYGKMIVSEITNPLFSNPKHTYLIGSGSSFVIQKAEMAADELSQTRFGDYPLLLFTTQGIFAMEQGSGDVLYSRTVKVSTDMITGSCDTLSVHGIVFFITVRGVMTLRGRNVDKISEPIEHLLDDKYLSAARLFLATAYDEVLLFNPSYTKAYVYKLGEGWSTRDFPCKPVGGFDSLANGGIFSINGRESKSLGERLLPSFLTRPFMLGSDDYKHIDVFVGYMTAASDASFSVVIEASNNLTTWTRIGNLSKSLRLRHTASSWRYYRIRMTVDKLGTDEFFIVGFDFEYYTRFARHLRPRT